jgi:hypothetical protein
MLRKLIAVGALVLATMCLAAPVAHAGVGLVLDEPMTIDLVAPADFAVVTIDQAIDLAVPIVADLPGSGEGDGDDQPIAALCPITAPLMLDAFGHMLRDDDVGWCRT